MLTDNMEFLTDSHYHKTVEKLSQVKLFVNTVRVVSRKIRSLFNLWVKQEHKKFFLLS